MNVNEIFGTNVTYDDDIENHQRQSFTLSSASIFSGIYFKG